MNNGIRFTVCILVFFTIWSLACEKGVENNIKAERQVTVSVSPQPQPAGTPTLNDIPGIFGELEKRNAGDPQMSEDKLAELGNELIQKMGYTFYLDVTHFKSVTGNRYTFTGTDGKTVELEFEEAQGGACFDELNLPVEKINAEEITIVKDGVKYFVKRPKGFYTEEFVLVDKSLKKAIRKWAAPINAMPVGISNDGKKIYFIFEIGMEPDPRKKDPSVSEMLSEISEDGTIRFVPKNFANVNKGAEFEGYPKYSEISYRRFVTKDNTEYIVKFSYPCT